MWKRRLKPREGWLLPDALLALSIVALTVILAQQMILTTQRLERIRERELQLARVAHDRALIASLKRS
ncbi:hypothetical protein [Levilactobacillus lindianensis]|uniref:hypothetical protein n=1 Tax=Levilactobacillus lindianensis TaxID=2486018 RepID=UPI000F74B741|nr:hypothetical protein [Levilactobacillus lindianensis]